jgi:hypothetical protein
MIGAITISREVKHLQRDPVSLAEYKRLFPVFKDIPDSEFSYHDGKWLISLKATKQLAYKHKHKELIKYINEVEEKRNELKSN